MYFCTKDHNYKILTLRMGNGSSLKKIPINLPQPSGLVCNRDEFIANWQPQGHHWSCWALGTLVESQLFDSPQLLFLSKFSVSTIHLGIKDKKWIKIFVVFPTKVWFKEFTK